MQAMPLTVLTDGTQANPHLQTVAWATALVLLAAVLLLSIVARTFASYVTRHAR
jgi:ABC-type phosphate transport system permease subunit